MGEKKKRWQLELDDDDEAAMLFFGCFFGMVAGGVVVLLLVTASKLFSIVLLLLLIIGIAIFLITLWSWCIRTLWFRHQRDKEYFKDDDESADPLMENLATGAEMLAMTVRDREDLMWGDAAINPRMVEARKRVQAELHKDDDES